MLRPALTLVLLAATLGAASVRLYLKDGSYHSVREYQVEGDRVRYYSTERGDWEEVPLDLIDLAKTKKEAASREQERKATATLMDAEEKAERAVMREAERIPYEPGVFLIEGEKVTTLKQAESKMVTDRKRSILKAMSPIPIVAGKATVELDGVRSAFVLDKPRPEFYMRLANEERFAIVKVTPTKTSRIVQRWSIVPVTKEVVEDTAIVETFKQQLGEGLYKLWPTKPLEPGEYAVVEYTEGAANIQVWDFAIAPAAR